MVADLVGFGHDAIAEKIVEKEGVLANLEGLVP
jgi:hypothetical protein